MDKVGIEYSLGLFFKKLIHAFVKYVYLKITTILRKSDSKIIGYSVRNVFLNFASIMKIHKLPFRIREIISLSQPVNPLKDKALPTIDIAIPCHVKDFENLPLVVHGVRANIRNPVGKIILITPDYLSKDLQSQFPDCHVLTDENVLGADIANAIARLVPQDRRGWITQQIIKFRVALFSGEVATLILDADTILLKPRIFLDAQGIQILCIATEYHSPYKEHQRKVFGGQNHLLSFVTHHQLMKRDTLRGIFGQNGEGLLHYINLADFSERSAVSEYDTYGEWILAHKPNEITFAKWNNFPVRINPSKTSYKEIQDKYRLYYSISSHSYL